MTFKLNYAVLSFQTLGQNECRSKVTDNVFCVDLKLNCSSAFVMFTLMNYAVKAQPQLITTGSAIQAVT